MQDCISYLTNYCNKNNLNQIKILEDLKKYVDLLLTWNERLNLISKSTIETIWTRHILDSAQLLEYIPNGGKIVDLGSGSGLPGVVLSIVLDKSEFLLVEKSPKKCLFLNDVVKKLDLDSRVEVLNGNADSFKQRIGKFLPNFITSRAFKPLDQILDLVDFYDLKSNPELILPKGRAVDGELSLVKKKIEYIKYTSIVDLEACVLRIFKTSC